MSTIMEDRKRPFVEDAMSPSPAAKKRALASGDGSPMPVVATAEPQTEDDVELFQKGAIYRCMKQYSREKERAELRVAELESRRNVTEAALVAIETIWNHLISVIRDRVDPMINASEGDESFARLGVYTSPVEITSQLKSSLEERARLTEGLVDRLLQSTSPSEIDAVELQRRIDETRAEAEVRRTELELTQARLKEAADELQKYKDALSQAEKRQDRARSRSVIAMESKISITKEQPTVPQTPVEEVKPKTEEGVVELGPLPPLNGHAPPFNSEEFLNWQTIAAQREIELQKAAEERLQLADEIRQLKEKLATLPVDAISSSHIYEALRNEATDWRTQADSATEKLEALQTEVSSLRNGQAEYKAKIEAEAKVKTDELETRIEKKDQECNRLRQERDSRKAENDRLRSRKEKESWESVHELKTLVKTQGERIMGLQSEVTRLRAKLASGAAAEDVLSIILDSSSVDPLGNEETVKQLLETKQMLQVLQYELDKVVAGDMPVQQIARLQKLEAIFGSDSPDLRNLALELQSKEEELRSLRSRCQAEEAASNEAYVEIDRLSAAWELAVKQSKAKVFDLVTLEEKYNKLVEEKAKLDNKYFGLKTQVEAGEGDRKILQRANDKQKQMIDISERSQKELRVQKDAQDKEIDVYRRAIKKHADKIQELETAARNSQRKMKALEDRIGELNNEAADHQRYVQKKREDIRKVEEEVAVARAKAERAERTAKAVSAGEGTQAEVELKKENQRLNDILKCSCKLEYRRFALKTCGHCFCKKCLDARLETRQRKCPTCTLSFGQSDVLTLYFSN